jgi:phosphoglycerol transferase MdoB-like AlkP superfamily enzyme
MLPAALRIILQRIALLLVAYALTRGFFLYWNLGQFAEVSGRDIAMSFVHGLRFDLAAILFTNALLFPLWLAPTVFLARPAVKWTEFTLFMAINGAALGSNVMDSEYVKFIGKRNSFDLLLIADDVKRQSMHYLFDYWYLCLVVLAILIPLAYLAPKFKWDMSEYPRDWRFWFWRIVFVGLAVFGMRGGWQFKPLHPMNAYFTTSHELGLLTLNTPFNLIKSKPTGEIHRQRYFKTDREAVDRLLKMTDLSRPPLGVAKGWNVVVFIIESLSLEYMGAANDGKGYTPFLDELSRDPHTFFFKYNFANARRSIEGVPAVLCGLPAMMAEPVITSDFANNRMDCMPKVLSKRGYSTYFLHGAHNGSMHFETFSTIAGFENFVGLNEFPKGNPADFDEAWGVLDEPMFQYAAKTITEAKKPVMLSVFSLSSHSPYFIPPQYRGKFPKGTLEIHEVTGYTDLSLREFFKTASALPWFNNTIFVITGDHTQKSDQAKYQDLIGPWRVPLLIYVPGLEKGKAVASPDRVTQHADISHSVYDLLGFTPEDRLLTGQSVFDEGKPGRVYNYTSYGYWYLSGNTMVDMGRETKSRAFTHEHTWHVTESDLAAPEAQEALLDIQAVVHYVNEGLLGNSLHSWRNAK